MQNLFVVFFGELFPQVPYARECDEWPAFRVSTSRQQDNVRIQEVYYIQGPRRGSYCIQALQTYGVTMQGDRF